MMALRGGSEARSERRDFGSRNGWRHGPFAFVDPQTAW